MVPKEIAPKNPKVLNKVITPANRKSSSIQGFQILWQRFLLVKSKHQLKSLEGNAK